MEGTSQFNRNDQSRLHRQRMVAFFIRAWPRVWAQVPREERGGFLKDMAEDHLGALLSGMGREERAALMNGLLPLIAREFPLADLDLLSAFPTPQTIDGEPRHDSEERRMPDD